MIKQKKVKIYDISYFQNFALEKMTFFIPRISSSLPIVRDFFSQDFVETLIQHKENQFCNAPTYSGKLMPG